MSTLELLQIFPTKCSALLIAIIGVDPSESNLVMFYIDASLYHLSH